MEPVYERYSPQHPLPKEIQNLPRNDTVCHYCGVSYLIHREIKLLEEKIKGMEEELKQCRGCEKQVSELLEAVKDLQDSMRKLESENKQLKKTVNSMTQQLDVRTNQLVIAQEHHKTLEEDVFDLDKKISALTKENDSQRKRNSHLQSKMVSILNSLKQEKADVLNISSVIDRNKEQVNAMFADFWRHVKQLNEAYKADTQTLQMSLDEMTKEKDAILHEKKRHDEMFKENEELLRKVDSLQNKAKNLTAKLKSTQEVNEELKEKFSESEDNCRSTNLELNQYKELNKNMKQTIEDLNCQLGKKEEIMENLLQKSQMESHDLQQKLQASRREHKNSQDQLLEKETNEKEIHRKQGLLLSLIEQLRKSEHQLLLELESVKEEREQATISHQQQIEDLKESFKQKTTEYETWPLQLETALQQERNNHNKEMQEMKGKFTENFMIELEIEKQKYQELVDRYHEDNQNAEDKLKEQVGNAVKCHVNAIKDLEELLSTTRSMSTEKEESMKKEVNALKQVIKHLQTQLAEKGNETPEVTQLKTQLRSAQQEVTNLEEQVRTINQELEAAKRQIITLQETVQKECDERFELSVSLAAVRLELLQVKKTGGASKSPLHQSLPTVNKLRSASLPGTTANSELPTTSLSSGLHRNIKSTDRSKLEPLKPFSSEGQSSSQRSNELTSQGKETKRVRRFSTDQKTFFALNRKMSVERQRLLAVLTRNSTKCPK